MKKVKKIAMMSVMAFVIGVLGPVQTTYAATTECEHATTEDRLDNTIHTTRTHNVFMGYDGNYEPIIEECTVRQVRYTFGRYCTICNKKLKLYEDILEMHSIAH